MKKKIAVVMICAGMSVGLAFGFLGTGTTNSAGNAMAAQEKSAEAVTFAATCSVDKILLDNALSFEINGLEQNHTYLKLKSELNDLKAELAKIKKDTEEYQEKLAEIHKVWGRISMIIGELSSQVDVEMEGLLKISGEAEDFEFTSNGIYDNIGHIVEDLFE